MTHSPSATPPLAKHTQIYNGGHMQLSEGKHNCLNVVGMKAVTYRHLLFAYLFKSRFIIIKKITIALSKNA